MYLSETHLSQLQVFTANMNEGSMLSRIYIANMTSITFAFFARNVTNVPESVVADNFHVNRSVKP